MKEATAAAKGEGKELLQGFEKDLGPWVSGTVSVPAKQDQSAPFFPDDLARQLLISLL